MAGIGPTTSLERVIRELSLEKSLYGRLRVLARAYPLIRTLSPIQREKLALHAGGNWVWKYLERYFLRDGVLSEGEQAIQRALKSISDSDPKEMRRMVREVREGNRTAARDVLVDTVQQVLEDEAARVESEEAGTAADSTAGEPPAGARAGELPSVPLSPMPPMSPTSPTSPNDASQAKLDEGEPALRPARIEDDDVLTLTNGPPIRLEREPVVLSSHPLVFEQEPLEAAEPASVVGPEAPGGGNVRRDPSAEAVAASSAFLAATPSNDEPARSGDPGAATWGSERPGSPGGRGPAAPAETPRVPATSAWLSGMNERPDDPRERMSAVNQLKALRDLRRDPRRLAALGARERMAFVRGLGPGWAARRAVSQMIRSGAVTGLDEALDLIARLDSPTRQTWCLTDLLESRRLGPSERERVLGAAPTPSVRRRLERRARIKDSRSSPRRPTP